MLPAMLSCFQVVMNFRLIFLLKANSVASLDDIGYIVDRSLKISRFYINVKSLVNCERLHGQNEYKKLQVKFSQKNQQHHFINLQRYFQTNVGASSFSLHVAKTNYFVVREKECGRKNTYKKPSQAISKPSSIGYP